MQEDIKRLYKQDLIDRLVVGSCEEFVRWIEQNHNRHKVKIKENIISEMSKWACF